jgi:hypothetical protein
LEAGADFKKWTWACGSFPIFLIHGIDKKKTEIVLRYKEIQKGSVAKSYMS